MLDSGSFAWYLLGMTKGPAHALYLMYRSSFTIRNFGSKIASRLIHQVSFKCMSTVLSVPFCHDRVQVSEMPTAGGNVNTAPLEEMWR